MSTRQWPCVRATSRGEHVLFLFARGPQRLSFFVINCHVFACNGPVQVLVFEVHRRKLVREKFLAVGPKVLQQKVSDERSNPKQPEARTQRDKQDDDIKTTGGARD